MRARARGASHGSKEKKQKKVKDKGKYPFITPLWIRGSLRSLKKEKGSLPFDPSRLDAPPFATQKNYFYWEMIGLVNVN